MIYKYKLESKNEKKLNINVKTDRQEEHYILNIEYSIPSQEDNVAKYEETIYGNKEEQFRLHKHVYFDSTYGSSICDFNIEMYRKLKNMKSYAATYNKGTAVYDQMQLLFILPELYKLTNQVLVYSYNKKIVIPIMFYLYQETDNILIFKIIDPETAIVWYDKKQKTLTKYVTSDYKIELKENV